LRTRRRLPLKSPDHCRAATQGAEDEQQTPQAHGRIPRPRFEGYASAPGIGNAVWDALGDAVSKREKHLEVGLTDVLAKIHAQLTVGDDEPEAASEVVEGKPKEPATLAQRLAEMFPDIQVPASLEALQTAIGAHEAATKTTLVVPFLLAQHTPSTRWISVRLDLRHMGSCFQGMRNAGILDSKWSGDFHAMMVETVHELMREFGGAWGFTQVGGGTLASRSFPPFHPTTLSVLGLL
jgi:hypothetical protein